MLLTVDSRMFFTPTDWLDNHVSTDWEVASDIDFTNVVLSSYNDTVNLTTWTIDTTGLPYLLYFRVRYRYGYDTTPTPWSDPIACYRGSWCTLDIQDIATITISGYPDQIERAPIISTSPFVPATNNETHKSTDWTITDTDGNIVLQSLNDTVNLTSIKLPPEYLQEGKTYTVTVRHNGTIAHSYYKSLTFTVRSDPYIETPTIYLSDSTQIATVFTIYTSSFYSNLDTETHVETNYKITRLSDNTVIYNNTTNIHKTQISISSSFFTDTDVYLIEVTFYGNTLVSNTGTQYYETVPIKEWIPYTGNFTLQFSGFSPITGGYFYTYGGLYNPPSDIVYKHTIDTTNYKIDRIQVATLPYPVYRSVSVSIGDSTYIIGGITTDNTPIDTYIVHDRFVDTYTVHNLHFTYSHGAGVSIGTDIYLVGGLVDGSPSNAIYKIDTITNTVTLYDNLPFTIYRHGVSVIDTNIYVVGGIINETVSDTVYQYDTTNKSITTLTNDYRLARYDLVTVDNINDIVVAGGRYKNGIVTRDVNTVNIVTGLIKDRDPIHIGNDGSFITKISDTPNSFMVVGGRPVDYRPNTDKDVSYFSIVLQPSYTPPPIEPGIVDNCSVVLAAPIISICVDYYGADIFSCSLTYSNGDLISCSNLFDNGGLITCSNTSYTGNLLSCNVVYNNGYNLTCSNVDYSGVLGYGLSCIDVSTINLGYAVSCFNTVDSKSYMVSCVTVA